MNNYIAIDLETRGLIVDGKLPEVICVSIADGKGAECWEWDETAYSNLSELLEAHTPIFHNAAFDCRILRGLGLKIDKYIDTMILSYVWQPNGLHALKDWGTKLGIEKLEKPWEGDYPTEFNHELATYCVRDAEVTYALFQHLKEAYNNFDQDAGHFAKVVETPFTDIIMEMEETGLYIDMPALQALSTEILQQQSRIDAQLTELCPIVPNAIKKLLNPKHEEGWLPSGTEEGEDGRLRYVYKKLEPFQSSKNRHKAYLLQTVTGWKPTNFTKKGDVVVDRETLELIPGNEAKLLLEIGTINKIMSTFVEPFSGRVRTLPENVQIGRMFGRFNQTATRTGRLSSSNPNLQNIPARGDMGAKMRSIFIAPPGYTLIDGDLSNIEARILAYYLYEVCGDTSLVDVFLSGEDFHSYNASIWNVSRQDAKTGLFAIIYGAGAARIAASCDKSIEEAEEMIQTIDDTIPSIRETRDVLIEECRKTGLIHTIFGRRLPYPEINSKRISDRSRAERQLFNAAIQGTSADILKILVQKCRPYLLRVGFKIALNVHDEVVGYIPSNPPDLAEIACEYLTYEFNSDLLYPVPIKAEFRTGANWKEAHG